MNERYFRENDERVNRVVQKGLLCLLFVIPVLWILTLWGIFHIDKNQLLFSSFFIIVAAVVPELVIKHLENQSNIKYLTMTCVAVAVGMLNIIPTVGIYITLIIAVIISLLYADPKLTVFCGILQYSLMFVTEFFRTASLYKLDLGAPELFGRWISWVSGYTIEFVIMCSVCNLIAKTVRENQMNNGDKIDVLDNARERYEIVLENSSDIIFEYEIDKDLLTYFGPLLESDFKNGVLYNDAVVMEHFFASVQNDDRYHPDDVALIQQMINGGLSEAVTIRMPVADDWEWIEIEGNMVFKDNKAMKVMGKIRNVTARKLEEQMFLHNSERDGITGFFDRRIGIRILRERATEAGRTDTQIFLYVSLANCDELGLKAGSAFKDAVIMRVADILRDELSDMDLPVRFSESEFILYLANRNAVMIEQMLNRIEEACSKIYLGDNMIDSIGLKMELYVSLKDIENAVLERGLFKSVDTIKNKSIREDITGFAFHLLENSVDFDSSIKLLINRIGTVYNLDSVRVLRSTSSPGQFCCIYEWIAEECDEESEHSLLGTMLGIGKLQRRTDLYLYECNDMEEKSGYISFMGKPLAESDDELILALNSVSGVISSFLTRHFVTDMQRAKLDFLSTMSDEIKIPMNAITGMAEMIEQEEPSELIRFYTHDIKDYAERLQVVLQDILELANIEAGRLDIISDRFYLHSVFEEVKNIINIRIRNSGNQLVTRCDSNIPDGLVADRMRLRQVLLKLLEASIESEVSGNIGMELMWNQQSDERGILTAIIWDSGKEFSEDALSTLFNSNNHSLALAGRLVELMRGEIKAENSITGGRKISISIPCEVFDHGAYDYDHLGSDSIANNSAAIPFTAPWARILIVDDNSVNMEVMKGIIGKYKIKIISATSGREAIGILDEDTDFDVIFMDYMMPDMDGIETTQVIRGKGNPDLERIPIVGLTSFYEKGLESKFFMAGMNACIAKPINLKELADIMTMFIPEEKREG